MRARAAVVVVGFTFISLTAAPPIRAHSSTPQPSRWVHHVDLDGDGVADRVVITADRDLKIRNGMATGHYTVRVMLSSTGGVVTRRLYTDGYDGNVHHPWTPWFGTADLDHVGGKEILLGASSGASSETLSVLVYTEGRLAALPAPGGGDWLFNSDADVSNGYRCTSDGIETLFYSQTGRSFDHWIVGRDYYVWRDNRWLHTRRSRHHVHSKGQPRGTSTFGQFKCHGLDGQSLAHRVPPVW
jgi:hypothetical protein